LSVSTSSRNSKVSQNPRKIEPKQRRSSRLNIKHPGCHSRKSDTSKKVEYPKIVISSSTIENPKLETLYIPNKVNVKSLKVMKTVRIVKVNHHLIFSFGG
jgi:hypothetical protein